ncbi:hypothetical protein NLG97_g7875 [Lecanicillium saksenae]|uniref:Uncharacterized protein n=1 Tax=Lecanicillium saksenae TaxID=468837 RepID=A0ACC1QME3_9HYPO|nr:hypothetical protein NLG97_g7875 [Lecanicillium saksenae]
MVSVTTFFGSALALIATTTATKVHVNNGCINIAGQPVCREINNPIEIDTGSAEFQAKFPGDTKPDVAVPGCLATFSWPSNYGDIYFGADNCLYDSNGQNINTQCCVSGDGKYQSNPYHLYN